MKITFLFKWIIISCLLSVFNLQAQQLNFVKVHESNDIFSSVNNDRYFTQGLKVEVMSNTLSRVYKKHFWITCWLNPKRILLFVIMLRFLSSRNFILHLIKQRILFLQTTVLLQELCILALKIFLLIRKKTTALLPIWI